MMGMYKNPQQGMNRCTYYLKSFLTEALFLYIYQKQLSKRFFIFFSLLFLSCNGFNDDALLEEDLLRDSVATYLSISKDSNKSFIERMDAINWSFKFCSPTDTLFTKVLYEKSSLHFSLKQYDSLLFYASLLIGNDTLKTDSWSFARQHHLLGYYFQKIQNTPDSAFYHYNSSKAYFFNLKDSSKVGRRLLDMGIVHKNQNDFFGSKETITEALQHLNPKKDIKYISASYNALATNHRKLLNYQDAIKYYSKAINTTGFQKDKLIYQNNLAATYIDNEQFNDAISLLQDVAVDSLLLKNKKEYARVLDNLAYARWLFKKNINQKAFLEPLKIRQQHNDKRGQIASYTHLGEFYSKINTRIATSYFDSVIQLSKTLKIPRAEKDVLKLLMKLEPKNVNLRDRYVFLQDSLYAQELKVKTQFAKYKYDDKRKQESILRLEKENAEKELEATKQRTQKIVSFAFGVLLLMALGFLSYYFVQRAKRLKQQSEREKQKEVYATEAKLSRRVHDDFGGKLNQAIILLQNDAPKAKVLDVVGNAYDQSRDFSREINDVDTGPNFKNALFAMLGSFSENITLVTTGSAALKWETISEFTKKTIYKVLQELMTNMQRHSRASLVSIDFEQNKKKLKIEYSDDGIGTSKDKLNTKNGLLNTEKRIQAINGSITFDSSKNKGFKALIEVPN